MTPEGLEANYYFGGGGNTFVTPLGLAIFIAASLLILVLPRKYAVVPFLLAGILLPLSQDLVIGGLHFMLLRLLILMGWVRVLGAAILSGQNPLPNPMNKIDKVFLLWAVMNALTYVILWGAMGALIVKLGFLYTALGSYFLLRYLIRDREDVIRAIKILAILCVVIAPLMVAEHVTDRNRFAILGAHLLSEIRNGRVRAQGPFGHPIIAGTFAAMLLPLFAGLWWQGKGYRLVAALGVAASTAMVISSSSSTPVMTYLVGLLALCLWSWRDKMRFLRRGLVASLLLLQCCMKVPIWFLIAKVSALTGGTGWHRSELIDQFVRHFGEWWLVGTTQNAFWGLDMWDSINGYVNAGTEGGLITFVLFISLLVYGYKRIGGGRKLAADNPKHERLIWAIGCCLFANTVALFGITYFDQSVVGWYAVLVMISAATPFLIDHACVEADGTELAYAAIDLAAAGPENLSA